MAHFDFLQYREQVRAACPIDEVIGRTVDLRPKGRELVGAHHTHGSESGESFTVDPGKGVYLCWGCREGGDVFTWVMNTQRVGFMEAVHHLADQAGIPRPELSPEEAARQKDLALRRRRFEEFMEQAVQFYQDQLTDDVRAYLNGRGIAEATIEAARIGYAPPGGAALRDHLKGLGKPDKDLLASGLFVRTREGIVDFYQGRMIFPYLAGGRTVYLIGRQTEWTPEAEWEKGKYKKQLTHSEKCRFVSEVVSNRYLYGVDTVRRGEDCIITEGIADAIMAHQAGFACVSPVTVRFARRDHEAILRAVKRAERVLIVNDAEESGAGEEGALDTAAFLEEAGIETRIVQLPRDEGEAKVDLADYLAGHSAEELRDVIERTAKTVHQVRLERFEVPEDRTQRLPAARDFVVQNFGACADRAKVDGFIREAVVPSFGLLKGDAPNLLKDWKKERADREAKERRKKFQVLDGSGEAGKGREIVFSPACPYDNAGIFVNRFWHSEGCMTLRHHRDRFCGWNGRAYPITEENALRGQLYAWLDPAVYIDDEDEQIPFNPNRRKVSDIVDALKAKTHLAEEVEPPVWLEGGEEKPDPAREIVAVRNGLLYLPTRELVPGTPHLFNLNALDCDYLEDAPRPEQWHAFLADVWPDDPGSIDTLQEIFGYLLTSDTSLQKIFMLIGPKRSGKGTIGRVLGALVNVCAPTLTSLGTNFGLAPLIGKTLAIIADARLSGRADQQPVVESLLTISGEDAVTIDRKHLSAWTGRLRTRFLLLSNELPRMGDSSGALAGRFIILSLTKSFYGMEDPGLADRLIAELPGILAWAVEGWSRLHERGHFVMPESARGLITQLEELSSPVTLFVRDFCVVEPEEQVTVELLYDAWKLWCKGQGWKQATTRQVFGRDLRSALPYLQVRQPRDEDAPSGRLRLYEGIGLNEEAKGALDEAEAIAYLNSHRPPGG